MGEKEREDSFGYFVFFFWPNQMAIIYEWRVISSGSYLFNIRPIYRRRRRRRKKTKFARIAFHSECLLSFRALLIFYLVNFYGTIKFNYRARGECIVKKCPRYLWKVVFFFLLKKNLIGSASPCGVHSAPSLLSSYLSVFSSFKVVKTHKTKRNKLIYSNLKGSEEKERKKEDYEYRKAAAVSASRLKI